MEILNSTGQRVLRQQAYRPGQPLYVGTLPPGLYSVRFGGAARFVVK